MLRHFKTCPTPIIQTLLICWDLRIGHFKLITQYESDLEHDITSEQVWRRGMCRNQWNWFQMCLQRWIPFWQCDLCWCRWMCRDAVWQWSMYQHCRILQVTTLHRITLSKYNNETLNEFSKFITSLEHKSPTLQRVNTNTWSDLYYYII